MRDCHDKNRICLDRIDQAERKAVEKHLAQSPAKGISEIRMLAKEINDALHIIEEVAAETA